MPHRTETTHAADSHIVPKKLQEKLPQEDEERVTDPTHDASAGADMTSNAGVSRAVEESKMRKNV